RASVDEPPAVREQQAARVVVDGVRAHHLALAVTDRRRCGEVRRELERNGDSLRQVEEAEELAVLAPVVLLAAEEDLSAALPPVADSRVLRSARAAVEPQVDRHRL